MPATTDETICNAALLMLGANPIASLSETGDKAKLCAGVWPIKRDEVLRAHPWNCCIKRDTFTPYAVAPNHDWPFQYILPGDFVKVLGVGELGAEAEFRIEGQRLLTDVNPCLLRYVFMNRNPATWDPGLVHVMTLTLCAALAYPITSSTTLRDSMRQEAELAMRRAKSVDGQDDTGEMWGDSRLVASRFGSSSALGGW